jgi:hypothetical protein
MPLDEAGFKAARPPVVLTISRGPGKIKLLKTQHFFVLVVGSSRLSSNLFGRLTRFDLVLRFVRRRKSILPEA